MLDQTAKVLLEVKQEREFQTKKFGVQNHSPAEWLMILGEEVGEANQAALETHFNYDKVSEAIRWENYRAELVQVAAVAVAMVECLDRSRR